MRDSEPGSTPSRISDVERDTGIAKETLRVWERRYAFPRPARDASGERVYPADQVERLRLVKRLLDQGFRPGKIMHQSTQELAQLAGRRAAAQGPGADEPALRACLDLVRQHKLAELRQQLAHSVQQQGLRGFVLELLAPLTTVVGDEWAAGRLAVFEEHLYSEAVDSVMRKAMAGVAGHAAQPGAAPRILLTTVPQERHGLGLLMAGALFALEGAHCVSLGVQTPLSEIVRAARAHRADIVALSFSGAMSARATIDNVTELQGRLGETVQVWAGGDSAMRARRLLDPARVLDLDGIGPALARWRARQQGAAPGGE
jgi:MerR family transcriptional regulator, light-induced transcriptional regulator